MDIKRKRVLLIVVGAVAMASITGGALSLALFTSTTAVSSNVFMAGTVILTTDHPSTAVVTLTNMAPGDAVTGPLLVSNTGSLALRYAVSSVATNLDTLLVKDQLVLTIKTGVTTCTNAGFGTDGTAVYTGDLDSSAGKLIGDATSGADAGDRSLASSGSETLCFHVSLPLGSGNTFQGATTTATFTFNAEQTTNN